MPSESRLSKESISPETVGKILQDITDLLATAIGETEYNIIRVWKETLQQYRFLYDIQQRSVEDHNFVMLSLMTRSMVDGAASPVRGVPTRWLAWSMPGNGWRASGWSLHPLPVL